MSRTRSQREPLRLTSRLLRKMKKIQKGKKNIFSFVRSTQGWDNSWLLKYLHLGSGRVSSGLLPRRNFSGVLSFIWISMEFKRPEVLLCVKKDRSSYYLFIPLRIIRLTTINLETYHTSGRHGLAICWYDHCLSLRSSGFAILLNGSSSGSSSSRSSDCRSALVIQIALI